MERFSFSSSVASSYEIPIVTAKRTKVFWRDDKIYLEKMKKKNYFYDVFRVGWQYLCCEDARTQTQGTPPTCVPGTPGRLQRSPPTRNWNPFPLGRHRAPSWTLPR
jgi:hypothetical protein